MDLSVSYDSWGDSTGGTEEFSLVGRRVVAVCARPV